jgi:hypothetical protein
MWLLPSWDCLEQIQTFSGRLTWIFLVAGVILAAAGVMQRVYDTRADFLQATLDEKQESDRRGLQDRLNKAEAKLATRAESVTPEQLDVLVKTLEAIPNKSAVELWTFDDPECVELASLVVAPAFLRANWPIIKGQKISIWFPTTIGLQVQYLANPMPESCGLVADALAALDVGEVAKIVAPGGLKPAEGTFFVFVGTRPLDWAIGLERERQNRVDLERSLVPRTTLVAMARQPIAEVIRDLPADSVYVQIKASTAEAMDLGQAIASVLRDEGCLFANPTRTLDPSPAAKAGIEVLYPRDGSQDAAIAVARALTSAGMEIKMWEMDPWPDKPYRAQVLIREKP